MTNATLEQVKTLTIRPGAKRDRVILGVDLSEVESAAKTLEMLVERGYEPEIKYLQLAIGLHVFAVLKDEPCTSEAHYERLLEEWENLCEIITPGELNKAVRLWKGLSPNK